MDNLIEHGVTNCAHLQFWPRQSKYYNINRQIFWQDTEILRLTRTKDVIIKICQN